MRSARIVTTALFAVLTAGTSFAWPGAATAGGAPPLRWDVTILNSPDGPAGGDPVQLVSVKGTLVGLVYFEGNAWFLTSRDGSTWRWQRPAELPEGRFDRVAYPGGLNNVNDRPLFTAGDHVYLRVSSPEAGANLGDTQLFVSDRSATRWSPVALPAPPGKSSFPTTALRAFGRDFIAGAVYDPNYGEDSLDAAVWIEGEDGAWEHAEGSALSGDGNQTIFSLAAAGSRIVAGGGDGSLLHNETCCYFPFGLAFWQSDGLEADWSRADVHGDSYDDEFESAAAVGFVRDGSTLLADVASRPPRTATSRDGGLSWYVEQHAPILEGSGRGVVVPRASQVLEHEGRFVATTYPRDDCTDCQQGALALAASRTASKWRDVTPRFPCGTTGRSNYGFVSKPTSFGSTIAVLGGCGPSLDPFNDALLMTSTDNGAHWNVEQKATPTGGPITAVTKRAFIATLASDPSGGPVRAITVRTA